MGEPMNKKEKSVGVSKAKRLSDANAVSATERQVQIPPPAFTFSFSQKSLFGKNLHVCG